MPINFETIESSRVLAIHHGPGPTCVVLPYVQTRTGTDVGSSPFMTYYAFHCFAEDGEAAEFPVYFTIDKMYAKNGAGVGADETEDLKCGRAGGGVVGC